MPCVANHSLNTSKVFDTVVVVVGASGYRLHSGSSRVVVVKFLKQFFSQLLWYDRMIPDPPSTHFVGQNTDGAMQESPLATCLLCSGTPC